MVVRVKSGLLAGGIGILVALAVLMSASRSFRWCLALSISKRMTYSGDAGRNCDLDAGLPSGVILLMAGKQRAFLVAQTIASIGTSYCCSCSVICLACWGLHLLLRWAMSGCGVLANSDLKGIFQRHSLLYNAAGEKS